MLRPKARRSFEPCMMDDTPRLSSSWHSRPFIRNLCLRIRLVHGGTMQCSAEFGVNVIRQEEKLRRHQSQHASISIESDSPQAFQAGEPETVSKAQLLAFQQQRTARVDVPLNGHSPSRATQSSGACGSSSMMSAPAMPSQSACCENGCAGCVWDVYRNELDAYAKQQLRKDQTR
jgi:hypothetical protein